MDITIPYYEDNTRISNSAIGWYLKNGPSFLHRKLEGLIPDEKGSQLEKGTMIHEFILQPEEFYNDYYVFDGTKPTSDNQERFCQYLLNTTEIEPNKQLLEAYKKSYSIIGKSEDKMLSEAKNIASTLEDYMEAKKTNKTIITQKDLLKCEDVAKNIRKHKMASKLLDNKDWEKHHEFHINWNYNDVDCKSLLDCVKFNFTQKKCQLIDLKTTVKLWHFQDSIETYDYLRQLCFYTMAIYWYLEHEKNEDTSKWTMEWFIIAIDSSIRSDVRVFSFTQDQVYSKFGTIKDTLTNIEWHQNTNNWDYTVEYYSGNGCETLNLSQ